MVTSALTLRLHCYPLPPSPLLPPLSWHFFVSSGPLSYLLFRLVRGWDAFSGMAQTFVKVIIIKNISGGQEQLFTFTRCSVLICRCIQCSVIKSGSLAYQTNIHHFFLCVYECSYVHVCLSVFECVHVYV